MADLEKYLLKMKRMQDKKNESIRLSVDGEVFEFQKLPDDKYEDIQTRIIEFNSDPESVRMDLILRDLVYFSCEEIRNPELFAELNIVDPTDIVGKLFSKAETSAIGSELVFFNGMTDTDIVKKL